MPTSKDILGRITTTSCDNASTEVMKLLDRFSEWKDLKLLFIVEITIANKANSKLRNGVFLVSLGHQRIDNLEDSFLGGLEMLLHGASNVNQETEIDVPSKANSIEDL